MLQDFVANVFHGFDHKASCVFFSSFLGSDFRCKINVHFFHVILNHYLFLFKITANSHLGESFTVQDYFRIQADDDVFLFFFFSDWHILIFT